MTIYLHDESRRTLAVTSSSMCISLVEAEHHVKRAPHSLYATAATSAGQQTHFMGTCIATRSATLNQVHTRHVTSLSGLLIPESTVAVTERLADASIWNRTTRSGVPPSRLTEMHLGCLHPAANL
jgi:hypothetical protein